jgi:hypothetical protein
MIPATFELPERFIVIIEKVTILRALLRKKANRTI